MANDIYNDIESGLVTLLQADSVLGTAASPKIVNSIVEKLYIETESEYEDNLPRIGVFATGEATETDVDQGHYQGGGIRVLLEVLCAGGYSADVDSQMKRILAEIRRFVRTQNRSDTRLSNIHITGMQNGQMDITTNFDPDNEQIANIYLGYTEIIVFMNNA